MSQDLWRKAELLRREVESINAVLQVQGPGNERDAIYAFDALLADYQASHLLTGREIAPDDIAIYFPTTDTTEAPRLVPLSHGALLYAAWALGLGRCSPRRRCSCAASGACSRGGGQRLG